MISVAEALARVTADLAPLPAEEVAVDAACGRVLASDLAAKLTQPPFPASAMDGYAVRSGDVAALPATLRLIGEAAAGHPFSGAVKAGEAVRIFTGAAVPDGADLVIIQENTAAEGDRIEIRERSVDGFVRPAGGDFREGDIALRAGHRLTPRDLLLAAQMNHAMLPVRRRPVIAILPSGDELVPPGGTPGPGQIISSIPAGLSALIEASGGVPVRLGIARDTMASLAECIAGARGADIIITIGGASVGDHDLVQAALEEAGFAFAFHKVAMRPGKPLMFGERGRQRVLGVPGNPVSAMLCAMIFLRPMIARLLGRTDVATPALRARLTTPLEANGPRQHYMRAQSAMVGGDLTVAPVASQDSSLISILAAANCLIVRPPYARALPVGITVEITPLDF
jgi:molybdopterin molybdotransferase